MNCMYCKRSGELRVKADENTLKEDIFICEVHWKILQNPKTALPFLRGVLSMTTRGKEIPSVAKSRIDRFMDIVSEWKRFS